MSSEAAGSHSRTAPATDQLLPTPARQPGRNEGCICRLDEGKLCRGGVYRGIIGRALTRRRGQIELVLQEAREIEFVLHETRPPVWLRLRTASPPAHH